MYRRDVSTPREWCQEMLSKEQEVTIVSLLYVAATELGL